MASKPYDAIVVGARCAGSPLAMLLARKGHKVLVVDRATFPSDTISTHLIHPPGVAALKRWGLLDQVVATNCPPIAQYTFDFGPIALSAPPGTPESPVAYCPRRQRLDTILVEAASKAGAEVRQEFVVDELVTENGEVTGIRGRGKGGATVTERAKVVVGADGLHSTVAKAVKPEQYNEKPHLNTSYYTYWSGLPMNGGFETYIRPGRGFAAIPTNDDLTLIVVGVPQAEFETYRKDIEGTYRGAIDLVPSFAERFRGAKREERFVGTSVPNYLRKPYGPGWALVGDAGYNKDYLTAQGISDAFRDAETIAGALDTALSGAKPFDAAMGEYHAARDRHAMPMYEFTAQVATIEPPSPEFAQVLGVLAGRKEGRAGFIQVQAGVLSPAEFFAPENIGRLMATAAR
ncbi:MAG TPA: NAD(P)/FAD-dependent oxidoreductase [Candidatus Eisenbacteria bacterium]|nr:NAD(P)/FAD-dependent oxidoreductase [Candidatus Eisenbacteria bacterium]